MSSRLHRAGTQAGASKGSVASEMKVVSKQISNLHHNLKRETLKYPLGVVGRSLKRQGSYHLSTLEPKRREESWRRTHLR